MPETDAFDPTHALDGWRPPAPAPLQELDLDALLRPTQDKPLLVHAGAAGFDPTHMLDGWRPPAPAPLDLEIKSLMRAGTLPDEAKVARLKARGYEMLDIEDVELVEAPPPREVVEALIEAAPPPALPAEADLAAPPSIDAAAPAGLDLPLPDEEVWPLFMAEAQVLDAGTAPAVDIQAPRGPEPEPAPALTAQAPGDPAATEPAELAIEAGRSAPGADPLPLDEPAPEFEAPAAVADVEMPSPEPEVVLASGPVPAPADVAEAPMVEMQVARTAQATLGEELAQAADAPEPKTEPALAKEAELEPMSLAEPDLATVASAQAPEAEAGEPALEPEAAPEAEPGLVRPMAAEVEPVSAEPELARPALAEALDLGVPAAPEPGFEPVSTPAEPVPALEREPAPMSVAGAPALEAPELGDAVAAPAVTLMAAARAPIEPPVLDFHACPPPASPPPPSFIDDIRLPAMPPPPATVEAPVLDFRVSPPPPEPDPAVVIAGIELPQVAASPAVVEMPELDIAAFTAQPRKSDPRLLAHWQAEAWTALALQIAGASEELLQTPAGVRVESHAPQWLCAIWPPRPEDAPLGRWPELASLVAAETGAAALQQLLAELPDEAPLWLTDLEADWDLVAELVLHQDTGLRPSQAKALQELSERERNARLARLSEAYALQGRVARRRA